MRRHSVGSWIFFVGNLCRLFSHFTSHSLNSSHVCLSHHHENCQQISGLSSGENFSSNSKNLVEGQFFFPTRIFSSFAQFSAPPPAHTHQLARSASCLLFLLRKLPPNKSPTEATNFRRLKKYPQICQSRRKRSISGKEKWWQVSKNISSRTQYFCWKGIFSKFSFFQIYG